MEGGKMTEKDKEINELRRRNAELVQWNDELVHMLDEKNGPNLIEAVRTIYDNCLRCDICRSCALNRTDGCIITHSPYQWRIKDL